MDKGHLKEALEWAGSQHKYQKNLRIITLICWVCRTLAFLCPPFLYMDPKFHCSSNQNMFFHQKDACQIISECQLVDDFNLIAELGLFCDNWTQRLIIQSIFPLGSFMGLILLNILSDNKGRRPAFLLGLGLGAFSSILTIVGGKTGYVPFLVIAQFLSGFGAYPIMSLAYTYVTDFTSNNFRQKSVVMLLASGGLATIILGFFYLIRLNWIYFVLYFQLVPFVCLFIASYRFLLESPYILRKRDKLEEASQVLMQIAIYNNRQKYIPDIKQLVDLQMERNQPSDQSIVRIFKTIKQWKYLKTIIILIVLVCIANLNYLGISYSLSKQGLGYGYNAIVMGIVQSSSVIFLNYSATHFPRKLGIAGSFSITVFIGFLFLTEFVSQNQLLSTLFIGLSRVFAINAYCLVACVETQAFTVSIQSTAAGLIEGVGIIGATLAPLLLNVASSLQINPITVCAICVALGIWPVYFLKQTFHSSQNSKQLNNKLLSKQIEMQTITMQSTPHKLSQK